MSHIVCHHYVHMTHVKFFQKTDQMISTGLDLIFLDKYQLGFTLSYVRVLGFRTLHIYQGLSCLWRHNNARMIISLAWFHNLFLWDLCHFRGNWLKQTVLKYYATDSPKANPYFLSSFIKVLHVLGVVIWIHDSCCFLRTIIQDGKHQQLKFIIFIVSFSHSRICGSK